MIKPEQLGADAEFEKRLRDGKFCIQRCEDTGQYVFYPRQLSPYSGTDNMVWVETSGKGSVYSATTIRQKPERGGDYNLSIIELAEGPKMMSRVEGIPPDQVKIGMAVKARIAEQDGAPLIVFDPV